MVGLTGLRRLTCIQTIGKAKDGKQASNIEVGEPGKERRTCRREREGGLGGKYGERVNRKNIRRVYEQGII